VLRSSGLPDHQGQLIADQVRRLIRRAEVLRQIHSDKLFRVQKAHRRTTVLLIVVTTAVSFFGFTGTERLQRQMSGLWSISLDAVNMLYNSLVLATVFVAIVLVVYRLPERAADHHRAIQSLSEFILDCDHLVSLSQSSSTELSDADLTMVTTRYKGLAAALPPISDEDFLASKQRYLTKKAESHAMQPAGTAERSAGATQATTPLEDLLDRSPVHRTVLEAVRDVEAQVGTPVYICGGFIRNLVWDTLHGYVVPTAADDIDVVYISANDDVVADKILAGLRDKLPNVPWTVRNLATIKPKHGTGSYVDLKSALCEFPETASAIAVHVTNTGQIDVIAPFGTGDLFSGVVRATRPDFLPRVLERAAEKSWLTTWPKLQILQA
jgi:hypothetical protein